MNMSGKQRWIKLLEKITGNGEVNAEEAYNVSMYGSDGDYKTRLKFAIKEINRLIKFKIGNRSFSLVHHEEDDSIIDEIMKHFEEKGYAVVLIDSNTHPSIVGKHIFISWIKKNKNDNRNNIQSEV